MVVPVSDAMEGFEDLFHLILQRNRAAVRARHRAIGLRQLVEQVTNLRVVQRRVHLDRGVAGDGRGDSPLNGYVSLMR